MAKKINFIDTSYIIPQISNLSLTVERCCKRFDVEVVEEAFVHYGMEYSGCLDKDYFRSVLFSLLAHLAGSHLFLDKGYLVESEQDWMVVACRIVV